jgi:hypothetical protein
MLDRRRFAGRLDRDGAIRSEPSGAGTRGNLVPEGAGTELPLA